MSDFPLLYLLFQLQISPLQYNHCQKVTRFSPFYTSQKHLHYNHCKKVSQFSLFYTSQKHPYCNHCQKVSQFFLFYTSQKHPVKIGLSSSIRSLARIAILHCFLAPENDRSSSRFVTRRVLVRRRSRVVIVCSLVSEDCVPSLCAVAG